MSKITRSGTDRAPDYPAETVDDLIEIDGIPDFWEQVRRAPHIALFLDYDGTLAPFHVDRMQAVPLPGTVEALSRIVADDLASVTMVSGRPVAEVLELLGDLGVIVVGSHGYEVHRPDGVEHVIEITPEQASILDAAFEEARRLFDPARLERKAASVAAHFRGLNPLEVGEVEEELERRWRAAGSVGQVEFRPFNGGLELRAAGRTKGTAIEEFLLRAPESTLPIYVGDDDTDEDAFSVLAGRGVGIKVGPRDAVTKAAGRVDDCAAVRQLLRDWPKARSAGDHG